MNNICLTTFCNKGFLERTENTIKEVRTNGKYSGTIVLLVGDDLKHYQINDPNVVVKYFLKLLLLNLI